VSVCQVSRMRTQGPNLGVKAFDGEPTLSQKIKVAICACDKDESVFGEKNCPDFGGTSDLGVLL